MPQGGGRSFLRALGAAAYLFHNSAAYTRAYYSRAAEGGAVMNPGEVVGAELLAIDGREAPGQRPYAALAADSHSGFPERRQQVIEQ